MIYKLFPTFIVLFIATAIVMKVSGEFQPTPWHIGLTIAAVFFLTGAFITVLIAIWF